MRHLVFLFCLLGSLSLRSQIYKTAIDLRLDNELFGFGLTQKLLPQVTAIGAMDFRMGNEIKGTALIRYHIKWAGRRINFYPGVGVHSGVKKDFGNFRGIDFTLGAEYKSVLLPLVVAYEFQPVIHTAGNHPDFYNLQSVLTVRYVLVKDKKKLFDSKNKKRKKD